MRTTLTLDEDVAQKCKEIAVKLSKPFKTVVNEALRSGLEQIEKPLEKRPFKTEPHDLGLREGLNLDNVQELLSQVESEDYR